MTITRVSVYRIAQHRPKTQNIINRLNQFINRFCNVPVVIVMVPIEVRAITPVYTPSWQPIANIEII
jgi:hypothetical protein